MPRHYKASRGSKTRSPEKKANKIKSSVGASAARSKMSRKR